MLLRLREDRVEVGVSWAASPWSSDTVFFRVYLPEATVSIAVSIVLGLGSSWLWLLLRAPLLDVVVESVSGASASREEILLLRLAPTSCLAAVV